MEIMYGYSKVNDTESRDRDGSMARRRGDCLTVRPAKVKVATLSVDKRSEREKKWRRTDR